VAESGDLLKEEPSYSMPGEPHKLENRSFPGNAWPFSKKGKQAFKKGVAKAAGTHEN